MSLNLLKGILKRGLQAIVLTIGGVFVALLVVEYSDASWLPSARWLALLIYTPLVFGAVIREFHGSWRRMDFWLWLVGLLVVHAAGYAVVLTWVKEFRPVWFLPLSLAEGAVLIFVLHALGYNDPTRRSIGSA